LRVWTNCIQPYTTASAQTARPIISTALPLSEPWKKLTCVRSGILMSDSLAWTVEETDAANTAAAPNCQVLGRVIGVKGRGSDRI
jgi:hypothetical protein